jgi:membrane-bound serine protease (ClpP class)
MAALLFWAAPVVSDTSAEEIWLVDLKGAVGPASVDLVIRSIDDANEAGAHAIIVRMDTPGGLDKAMRDLVQAILASPIPVISYVAPNGARAASAGTYISYASHIAVMAPATNIGSSTPVSIAPQGLPTEPPAQPVSPAEEDSATPVPSAKPLDAMGRKVINDAVAYLQGLAELRGRNLEWAEKTVRDGANLRASVALEMNVVDLVAEDIEDLLKSIDGQVVTTATGEVTLDSAGASIRTVESDWRHDLLAAITDPSIAYGLLIVGLYALMLEFYNPGLFIPAITGLICILLGAYGLQLLPVNYVGLALVGVGVALMIAEVVSPTIGVLGFGGVIAFVLGSMMMFDSEVPGYQLPITIIVSFAVTTGLAIFFIVGMAMRARAQKIVSGIEAMIGGHATVTRTFTPHDDVFQGQVWAFGESWRARSRNAFSEGDDVRVDAVEGLVLEVSEET